MNKVSGSYGAAREGRARRGALKALNTAKGLRIMTHVPKAFPGNN